MKAERFRQIRNLFDATMDREPEVRSSFLQEACKGDEDLLVEIGRLLAAQGEPTLWIDESLLGRGLPRLEGGYIGQYEILRQLGEGGMGTVYLAAIDAGDKRRLVAIKIVRPEMATEEVLRRFKREREILEALDHPNIARVLDGGMTEERLPYLVMEYVQGQHIDAYCDDHRLDLTARVRLFESVCDAVQYAHENRVVHRDLKPHNILVTDEGVVKLLDFGIAKVVVTSSPDAPTCLTRTDLLLMTPEYASPELVLGMPATPATDVYALGMILYELLTGRRPYRMRSRIFREIVRVISEEPATRPSAVVAEVPDDESPTPEQISVARATSTSELRRGLSGNIDCILMKSLEKEPSQRYRSVQGLREDLQRHLSGRTIEALRSRHWNTGVQFLLRNWWWLMPAATAGLVLYGGLVRLPRLLVVELEATSIALIAAYFLARFSEGAAQARVRIVGVVKALGLCGATVAAWLALIPAAGRGDEFHRGSAAFFSLLALTGIAMVIAATFQFAAFLRWRDRERGLGALSMDLGIPAKRKIRVILQWIILLTLLCSTAVIVHSIVDLASNPSPANPFVYVFFGFFGAVGLVLTSSILYLPAFYSVEVRRRGIVGHGMLVPWKDIVSYVWESSSKETREKVEFLNVRLQGSSALGGFRPAVRLSIPRTDQAEVDSILLQQLMEWPT